MLRVFVGTASSILLALALVLLSYAALNNSCSSSHAFIQSKSPMQPDGAKDYPEGTESSKQGAAPQGEKAKPTATFELRIPEGNKIEGSYYADNADREKEDWGHKFLCDAKIGEFTL